MKLLLVLVVSFQLTAVLWPGTALGQEKRDDEIQPAPVPNQPPPTPSMLGAGRAADLVYGGIEGRIDPGGRAGFESTAEAPLAGPVSFRVGVSSGATADRRVAPSFLLKADLLNQHRHGLDGAIFGGYRGEGFNRVPAVEFGVALGRRSESLMLMTSVAYGQGLQAGERYGDVRAAGLARVHRRVNAGLDGRARFDLEIDGDEPAGEAAVDGVAGPLVTVALGRFVLSGQAGVGVLIPRADGPTHVGPTTRLGLGASF